MAYTVQRADHGFGPTGDFVVVDPDGSPVGGPNRVGVWDTLHSTRLDAEHAAEHLNERDGS